MSELSKRLSAAKEALDARWSADRESVIGQRLARRIHQRERARRAAVGGTLVVVLTALAALTYSARRESPAPDPAPTLRFADGSFARALTPQTRLVARPEQPDETAVDLLEGAARFEVVHRPGQHFRVEAGDVTVEVIGTRFTVEREGAQVRVAVEHGRVRVQAPWGGAELTDGESQSFTPPPPPPSTEAEEPALAPAAADRPGPSLDWHALARQGEFDKAYDALGRAGPVRDVPQELLLASDVARLTGHPQQAADHLERLLQRHAKDPRAPLAAFTLGRVLLDELGRPSQAADAFARSRALDGAGPLAEDALAREVEAWSRAGELDKARVAAQQYVERYPGGQRLRSVRRFGGLE